jgi:hypothetical protein
MSGLTTVQQRDNLVGLPIVRPHLDSKWWNICVLQFVPCDGNDSYARKLDFLGMSLPKISTVITSRK